MFLSVVSAVVVSLVAFCAGSGSEDGDHGHFCTQIATDWNMIKKNVKTLKDAAEAQREAGRLARVDVLAAELAAIKTRLAAVEAARE